MKYHHHNQEPTLEERLQALEQLELERMFEL